VRIQVEGDSSGAGPYSNPIHFLRDLPAAGVPAPRFAAVLGPIQIRSARAFTTRSVAFDSTLARLELGGDESPPGAGELVIDCGSLGEPGGVLGAANVSFDAGLLTVSGFAGDGSVVEVLWGPVFVSETPLAGDSLSLGSGWPNPFGQGLLCAYSVPVESAARLDVIDVRGRLVRTLVDSIVARGAHRAAWDGTDARGQSAAPGVYFLRLESAGRVLTSKAVKVR
jgi:hypothetical protein